MPFDDDLAGADGKSPPAGPALALPALTSKNVARGGGQTVDDGVAASDKSTPPPEGNGPAELIVIAAVGGKDGVLLTPGCAIEGEEIGRACVAGDAHGSERGRAVPRASQTSRIDRYSAREFIPFNPPIAS